MTVALITGAGGGIGSAIARRLSRAGMSVAVADRDAVSGAAVAEEVGGLFIPLDVTRPEDNQAAVAKTISVYGRLDVAVLNAGVPGQCGLHDFTPERYRETMAIDLDGVVYGLDACVPALRPRGGSVVVVSSLAGLASSPDIFYAAAKHALIGLVRSAAMLLSADGIRVNALCPGLADTPIIAPFRQSLVDAGLVIADPDQIAETVELILADKRTGLAWVAQAGQAAAPVEYPRVTIAGTTGETSGHGR
ncbi:SDR family oxidoreductase [Nonomuraea sp. KC401]|uniref:SDR family NAD(P)-dependent oxidoreductase n=1 Tax=unclassified Nonomuraea TaxID=2593643 RepID=UPI0010FE7EA0|nr:MULTISPECIES: SDR family oxidoreductase [unclassified Nonomuraea]NBE97073.1 SDR family NAD(P)-dependent oxidoreductase [Nonomuraea sp. K271]TLF66137.1 SDR family oxidoreductase [Nonomuraea sp. KC401]